MCGSKHVMGGVGLIAVCVLTHLLLLVYFEELTGELLSTTQAWINGVGYLLLLLAAVWVAYQQTAPRRDAAEQGQRRADAAAGNAQHHADAMQQPQNLEAAADAVQQDMPQEDNLGLAPGEEQDLVNAAGQFVENRDFDTWGVLRQAAEISPEYGDGHALSRLKRTVLLRGGVQALDAEDHRQEAGMLRVNAFGALLWLISVYLYTYTFATVTVPTKNGPVIFLSLSFVLPLLDYWRETFAGA